MDPSLPVAVIGAGPVGLAAASHLVERGITPLVLERGDAVGAALRAWAHVRLFSPWSYAIDAAASRLLGAAGWQAPAPQAIPTGGEIVRHYLEPLAAHPALAPSIRLGARVVSVGRAGLDKTVTAGRNAAPFTLRWTTADGALHGALARAVIDASGTWMTPNPAGADGQAVAGEAENADRIAYGIPDVLGADRAAYAGRRTLVLGAGHSAINVVLDLLRLRKEAPGTRILWGLRRNRPERLFGGGDADSLPARGALGLAAKAAIRAGTVELLAPFAIDRIARDGAGLRIAARHDGREAALAVDRMIAATGFRPDLSMLRELRVALDPALEAPPALAPLIDPNLHSCGTVPPHGAAELAHPESGLYIVGAKSYGRAPTFLMATGYEQVRSVAAAIAGDLREARAVRLVLPETGVCNAGPVDDAGGCCGGPPPEAADACCAADAAARTAGAAGCGCA